MEIVTREPNAITMADVQITIQASGAVADVNNAVATQIKQARKDHPEGSALLDTARDYINAQVRQKAARPTEADPAGTVPVAVTFTITVRVSPVPVETGSPGVPPDGWPSE